MRHDVAHQPCLRDTEREAFDYLETTTPSHLAAFIFHVPAVYYAGMARFHPTVSALTLRQAELKHGEG
jgi:hypothetical protein